MDIINKKYGSLPLLKCLDHGFVKLIDCMPREIPENEESADYVIAEAARCSYKRGTKTIREDKALIRYLMRHQHTSPFEMIEFKFHMKLPIFVARQVIRHRVANLNELSGRYSEIPEEYYIPEKNNVRLQDTINIQGSEGIYEDGEFFNKNLKAHSEDSWNFYRTWLEEGIAREQCRMVLPLNAYTEWYWKMDLKNLLHFLDLRCDSHAQQEIQVYANAILELIKPIVPWTIEAWEDYSPYRGGIMLTKYEIAAIRGAICQTPTEAGISVPNIEELNKLEQKEWKDKAKILGFEV